MLSKFRLAANYLRDDALQFYLCLNERVIRGEETPLHTLDDLVEVLSSVFVPPQHQMLLRDQLKALKQVGSVQNYVIEVRKLNSMIERMSEEDRMYQFIDGLKHATQAEVRYQSPQYL
jgi:hypothetical protein